MTFNLPPSPALLGVIQKDGYLHVHVATGELVIDYAQDLLSNAGGLPIAHGDGIQHFHFQKGTKIWAMGGSGGNTTGTVLFP